MIKVKGTICQPRPNIRAWNAALQASLKAEQKEAIAYWLMNVLQNTPVYTGTAQATMVPLSRAIGWFFSIAPRNTSKKFFRYKGTSYPLGIGAGASGQYSSYKITQQYGTNIYIYTFEFNLNLLYAVWNNRQVAPAWLHLIWPTPWQGLEIGARAFQIYVQNVIPKNLPNMNLAIVWTKIKVK